MTFLSRLLANSLAFFFRLLPESFRWAVARGLAWLWFDALRLRRYTILRNLSIAFPQTSHEERYRLARASMVNMSYSYFVEFCLLPTMTEQSVKEDIQVEGLEHYENARKKGKGVLWLSLHLGPGDVAIAAMALMKIPTHVISKKFKNKFLNSFWFGVREKMGAQFIEPHGRSTPFDILKATKKNEGVVFVIDQYMGPPYGVGSTFFGKKTGTAYGLALFAIKTGAPVLPIYIYRDDRGMKRLVILPEVENITETDKDLQIKRMTQKYNDIVESIVRKFPEQWMWVHRRWKGWRHP